MIAEEEPNDPFDLAKFALSKAQIRERRARVPRKIAKRKEHFAMLPMGWFEKLQGAAGQTYRLAWYLLYMHWKGNGQPIKLANGMLLIDGISRYSKWKGLSDLERRGLIVIERRPNRSPMIGLII
jgi:hypothetical protein